MNDQDMEEPTADITLCPDCGEVMRDVTENREGRIITRSICTDCGTESE